MTGLAAALPPAWAVSGGAQDRRPAEPGATGDGRGRHRPVTVGQPPATAWMACVSSSDPTAPSNLAVTLPAASTTKIERLVRQAPLDRSGHQLKLPRAAQDGLQAAAARGLEDVGLHVDEIDAGLERSRRRLDGVEGRSADLALAELRSGEHDHERLVGRQGAGHRRAVESRVGRRVGGDAPMAAGVVAVGVWEARPACPRWAGVVAVGRDGELNP